MYDQEVTKNWKQICCPLVAKQRILRISLLKCKWSVKLRVWEGEIMKKCLCETEKSIYHLQSQSGFFFFLLNTSSAENHTPFTLVPNGSYQLEIIMPRRKYLVFYGESFIHLIN